MSTTTPRPAARVGRKAAAKKAEAPQPPGFEAVPYGLKAKVNHWLHAIQFGDPKALNKTLDVMGFERRRDAEGKLRLVSADSADGSSVIGETSTVDLFIKRTPHFPSTESDRVLSETSDFSATATELLWIFCGGSFTKMEKLLQEHFSGYKPVEQEYFAARYGTAEALDEVEAVAARQVLPKRHDGTVQLCKLRALNKAAAVARLKEGSLPYATVSITNAGDVAELNWHGQGASEQERKRYKRVKQRLDMQRRDEIEREVQAFRAERLADAGLR